MDRAALTRSLTYIQANLDGDLSLRTLAAVARCSPAYYARKFAHFMSESPKAYTSRLRLERAALRLVLLRDSVLRVGLDHGYASHETFTRAFRRRFGVGPRQYRGEARGADRMESGPPHGAEAAPETQISRTVVRQLQPMSLAFIRHVGPYEQVPLGLWDRLADWARRRRLPGEPVLVGIALDAPGITRPDSLRFDAAIRVPGEFNAEGEIGHQRFEGGAFALTTCVGPLASLPAAYQAIFGRLWSAPGLECLGLPCVEFYRVNRIRTDLAIVHTEVAVPVRDRGLQASHAARVKMRCGLTDPSTTQ